MPLELSASMVAPSIQVLVDSPGPAPEKRYEFEALAKLSNLNTHRYQYQTMSILPASAV